MDNRRFSARADMGASRSARPAVGATPFLDRAVELTRVNWEIIFFAGMILLAVLTRLWDLGPRALHHDESIHAYFSNHFLKTGDYTATARYGGGYDPTYHGPFLYHVTALSFFLFGTTDATARLMPALFGIALVALCWWLRPFIGRIGAMLAAMLIVLSPSISYYSRSLRHDIFSLTMSLLLFICVLQFMRTHQSRWVIIGAAAFAISFSSHELTYIIAFVFVAFLGLAALLFPSIARRTDATGRDEPVNPVRSAFASLATQRWTLIGAVLVFAGIYAVLFTNMLIKPNLILSGFTESLSYWLGQHGETRGDQPAFYYFLLMLIYEPLAFFVGLGTVVYMIVRWVSGRGDTYHSDDAVDVNVADTTDEYGHELPSISSMRGLTLAFLAFWAFGSFIAFSLAGERMPWLNMQPALPFTLLAAAGLGRLLTHIEWREVWKGGGAFLAVTVVLFIFSAFALIALLSGKMPAPSGASAEIQGVLRTVLLFGITLGLLGLAGWLTYKLLPGRAVKIIGATFAVLLAAYGLRSMMLLNYRHGDVPVEMMVYTQSAPDVPIVASMLERLSRDETAFDAGRSATDVTGGRGLQIAIDEKEAIGWPFNWYFRDMRALAPFNTAAQTGQTAQQMLPPSVPVILVSETYESDASFQSYIQDKYTSQKFVLNWWFPEETYKVGGKGDFGLALNWLAGNGLKYFLYRDPGMPLGSRNFYLHIRNDLAAKTGLGAVVPSTPVGGTSGPSEDGPVYNMLDLAPAGVERGQFKQPRGITTGPDGSFYVVDTGNLRVQKFDAEGKFVALIGRGKGEGDGQFKHLSDDPGVAHTGPGGIAVDGAGNIYVADTWNHRIQKFDKDGKFLAKWGGYVNLGDAAGAADAARDTKFYGPRGVAIGPDGNVYVTDTGNRRVVVFDPNGRYIRQISSNMTPAKISAQDPFNKPGEFNEPVGVAVDASGNVYVADVNNKRIQKFNAEGAFAAQWPVPGTNWAVNTLLEEPFLATDADGNVYSAAPTGAAVLKFSPEGQVVAQKNKEGAVTLRKPTGIAVTADGTVYAVDTDLNGIVKMGQLTAP